MDGVSMGAVLDFTYFSIALLAAFFLRSRIGFLQRLFIPSCIMAGALLLLFGHRVLAVISLSVNVESYVYHLLTAVFVALALRGFHLPRARAVFTTTIILCQGMVVQAALGVIFTLMLIIFLLPGFFPGFGMQLMLGYSYDYAVAYNLGLQWEQWGFTDGRWSGFSFGVLGFIWAYFLGIILINWGRKQGMVAAFPNKEIPVSAIMTGVWDIDDKKPEAGRMTTTVHSIEALTLHLAVIGAVMFFTYVSMSWIIAWLKQLGPLMAGLGEVFWMLNFVFAVLLGTLARRMIEWLGVGHLLDRGLLARTCGTLVDYAVVAAIASIPLIIFNAYWIEVLLLAVSGAVATLCLVFWLSRKLQCDYVLERTVSTFAMSTGNISSGLALLRAVDPEMQSPVAEDLAYAGGISFIASLPLLALLNLPLIGVALGEPARYLLITLALLAGYSSLIILAWFGVRTLYRRSVAKITVSALD